MFPRGIAFDLFQLTILCGKTEKQKKQLQSHFLSPLCSAFLVIHNYIKVKFYMVHRGYLHNCMGLS